MGKWRNREDKLLASNGGWNPTWKVNVNKPPRRQDRQDKDNGKPERKNEKPTLWDPLGDLGVLAVGFYRLTFQVVIENKEYSRTANSLTEIGRSKSCYVV
jgi:hypothetical protein